ncbi:MAG: integrase arm-type DNA-binding domain-containing protein [Pseudomonadota bacterium]
MAKSLTAKAIENWTVSDKRQEVPDRLTPGLYFVVQPSGKKSWAIRYRSERRTRKFTMGTYPKIGLKEARELASEALKQVQLGEDPAADKTARQSEKQAGTFNVERIIADYIERHIKRNNKPSTQAEFIRLMNREFVPIWQGRDIRELTRRDVIALLDGIIDRGSPYVAQQSYAILSRFFRFCLERDYLETSPFTNIPKPTKGMSRDRVLSDEEIKAFWLSATEMDWPFGHLYRLLLLTGQRRDEVAEARWGEFDLEQRLWMLPADRAKNDLSHVVHLSEPAVVLLKALPTVGESELLFTTNGKRPISGFSRAKRKLDALVEGHLGHEPKDWRIHDFRRTAASGMAAIGIAPHVVEKILNHKSGTIRGVAAIYNRHEYREETKTALDAWASRIEALVGNQPDNVIRLEVG